MIAKKKGRQHSAMRASDSSMRIAGEEDAASVRSAGSSAERFSDKASFKTAAESRLSRAERRQQRSQAHRDEIGEEKVFLSTSGHAKRQQITAILGADPKSLARLPEPEIDRVCC